MTRNYNNKKLRAVFLAALMFLWVFAGTVAFAGGAAAQQSFTTSNGNLEYITPGGSAYQGQEIVVKGSGISTGNSYNARRADSFDTSNGTSFVSSSSQIEDLEAFN